MALTFGFYNSVEGDRKYDAIQFGRIFDGIITDGVYATYEKGMVVKASNNAGEVIIQPGRAWFNHTWNYNDADFVMEAPAPEVLLDRIDALVLDINEEQAVRANSFAWVTGTPSSNPVRPTLTNTTTHHQYPLCYVRRYAETTMIYTKDITNMVGTSECPFVTGVLEGMNIDAWINQWDNEFHTWEDATKVSFEAWMLTQQTDYTAWFNAVRDQLGTDMDEFEAWFETIKGIIDEEAATHLQAEIDEIKTMLPSGSHITITTTDTELFSRNVLLRDDFGHEITSKFNTSGVAVFETVPYVGSLTISSTDGIRTATNVVNTPYFARYEFPLAFWSATVDISSDSEMGGYPVTIKNSSGVTVTSVTLSSSGTASWVAIEPDTYKFSITYGGYTMEVSLAVTEETTYSVDLLHKVLNNVTIYSAANDTVSFTDSNGLQTVVTDSSGVAENVSITYNRNNPTITFTSSVAKAIGGSTADYSKTITLTESTTKIYVMPNGKILYWYGYKPMSMTARNWKRNRSTANASTPSLTQNTNYFRVNVGSGDYPEGVITFDTAQNLSGCTGLHLIGSGSGTKSTIQYDVSTTLANNYTQVVNGMLFGNFTSAGSQTYNGSENEAIPSDLTKNYYIFLRAANWDKTGVVKVAANIYALWID